MDMKLPVSKIKGTIQELDIKKSSGIVFYNDMARVCTVIKPSNAKDDRKDRSPYRMAQLFGGTWRDYNNHFIIQLAGCPLKCWYCYVDNLKADFYLSVEDIVDMFVQFKRECKKKFGVEVKVLHLMGGAPAFYCNSWPLFREELDKRGLHDVILFSDVIFVENYFNSKIKPWKFLDINNFILTGSLKGLTKEDFLKNTGRDLFDVAIKELRNYIDAPNFYVTLLNVDLKFLTGLYQIIDKKKVDVLQVVEYEVVKRRSSQRSNYVIRKS